MQLAIRKISSIVLVRSYARRIVGQILTAKIARSLGSLDVWKILIRPIASFISRLFLCMERRKKEHDRKIVIDVRPSWRNCMWRGERSGATDACKRDDESTV